MEERILSLRTQGKSYKEISAILGCSKSTISYYCADGAKEKNRERQRKNREKISILKKVENFQFKRIRDKSDDFQRERILVNGKNRLGKRTINFRWGDVIEKFGWQTKCYLTGETIDLKKTEMYQFDHIISLAKGGLSTLDNLGICLRDANQAKHDMSVEELLELCKKILEHHNYKVEKIRK